MKAVCALAPTPLNSYDEEVHPEREGSVAVLRVYWTGMFYLKPEALKS